MGAAPLIRSIRLAQGIPVRISLETLPAGGLLRLGSTASVPVRTGSAPQEPGN